MGDVGDVMWPLLSCLTSQCGLKTLKDGPEESKSSCFLQPLEMLQVGCIRAALLLQSMHAYFGCGCVSGHQELDVSGNELGNLAELTTLRCLKRLVSLTVDVNPWCSVRVVVAKCWLCKAAASSP